VVTPVDQRILKYMNLSDIWKNLKKTKRVFYLGTGILLLPDFFSSSQSNPMGSLTSQISFIFLPMSCVRMKSLMNKWALIGPFF